MTRLCFSRTLPFAHIAFTYSERFASLHEQVFKNWPQAQSREKCKCAHDYDHADEQHCE